MARMQRSGKVNSLRGVASTTTSSSSYSNAKDLPAGRGRGSYKSASSQSNKHKEERVELTAATTVTHKNVEQPNVMHKSTSSVYKHTKPTLFSSRVKERSKVENCKVKHTQNEETNKKIESTPEEEEESKQNDNMTNLHHLHEDRSVIDFWHRFAGMENFMSSYCNCNINMSRLLNVMSSCNATYTTNATTYSTTNIDDNNNNNKKNMQRSEQLEREELEKQKKELEEEEEEWEYEECGNDTLTSFLLLSEERIEVAIQSLLNAKKIIVEFVDDKTDKVCNNASNISSQDINQERNMESEKHVAGTINSTVNNNNDNNDDKLMYARSEHQCEVLLQNECEQDKSDFLLDESKLHVESYNCNGQSTIQPLPLSQLHFNDNGNFANNINTFSHWLYWVPCSQMEMLIALMEISEAAVPSRTSSFNSFKYNSCCTTSYNNNNNNISNILNERIANNNNNKIIRDEWWLKETCIWEVSLSFANQYYNMISSNKFSDNSSSNGSNNNNKKTVSSGNSNEPVKISMCVCPINPRVIDCRLKELRRIWELRKMSVTLMPRIKESETLNELNHLFFAYSDNVSNYLQFCQVEEKQNNNGYNQLDHTTHESVKTNHERFGNAYLQQSRKLYEEQVHMEKEKLPTVNVETQNTMFALPLPHNAQKNLPRTSLPFHGNHKTPLSNAVTVNNYLNSDNINSVSGYETKALHLCEEQLLDCLLVSCNRACLIDHNTWGAIGLRRALRCLDGVYWFDEWSRSSVLKHVIKLAEWYGLPPFLRSIRHHTLSSSSNSLSYALDRINSHVNGSNNNSNRSNSSSSDYYNDNSENTSYTSLHRVNAVAETMVINNTRHHRGMLKQPRDKRLSHTTLHERHLAHAYLLFLSPELLDKSHFTQPDPVQMQVVREEIIDLTIKHCAFGMIVGEADQIVHLLHCHGEYQNALLETRLRQLRSSSAVTSHCFSDPMSCYVQNTLLKAYKQEKDNVTSKTSSIAAKNAQRITVDKVQVDWICDNRWSDELTYYGILYVAVKDDNNNDEMSDSNNSEVNVTTTSADNNSNNHNKKLISMKQDMLYYIAAVLEYKREEEEQQQQQQ